MSRVHVLSLGRHSERNRVLIVKGVVPPRAAHEPIAAEILVADGSDATANDPDKFSCQRRTRPLFPLEPDALLPGRFIWMIARDQEHRLTRVHLGTGVHQHHTACARRRIGFDDLAPQIHQPPQALARFDPIEQLDLGNQEAGLC